MAAAEIYLSRGRLPGDGVPPLVSRTPHALPTSFGRLQTIQQHCTLYIIFFCSFIHFYILSENHRDFIFFMCPLGTCKRTDYLMGII